MKESHSMRDPGVGPAAAGLGDCEVGGCRRSFGFKSAPYRIRTCANN